MKRRKMITLLLTVVMLVASVGMTVYADVVKYDFSGSCSRCFTTRNYLEQSNKAWPSEITIKCTKLTYSGKPNHGYGIVQLVNGDGSAFGDQKTIFPNSERKLSLTGDYDYTTLKVRIYHPSYLGNGQTSTSTMTIKGTVEK